MSKEENNVIPTPFSVMIGEGETFKVGDKSYTVKPMLVGDAIKFLGESFSIGTQIFNLANKKAKAKLDEYLTKYCTNEKNEPMSINKVVEDEWNLVQLKEFMRKLCDISG